jgi:nucleoid-associated protein YgaU
MPKDAKFGLVVGTGLVLLIAILFFRKEPAAARPGADPASVAVKPAAAARRPARKHVVQEGETLFSLASRYYNDSTRFVELYQANREVLTTPEQLPEGAELVIPD